jgi:D-aspartate ligase
VSTPVLVMGPPRYVGPLGVMRSLGALGVRVYGLAHDRRSVSSVSRHCAGTVAVGRDGRPLGSDELLLDQLLAAGRRLGPGTILIPGSDEWSTFVAAHAGELSSLFTFPWLEVDLIEQLASKAGLYHLALGHRVPTPTIAFPRDLEEASAMAPQLTYPVILKPVMSRPGVEAKALADGPDELLERYQELEESPEDPNLMFQEYIPGGDEDVWIFNGYFDSRSRCLAAFTGQKIRQHPAHMGIASLGVYRQNREVIDLTARFLREVGYRGIVDIGYRYDRRDGQYKILDVNPRLGGAFRIFVDREGTDVVRAMYWDLTGKIVPGLVANEGRKWIKEDADLIASKSYRRLEGLSRWGWLKSLRGVQEGATWSLADPLPFALSMWRLVEETLGARWRSSRRRLRSTDSAPHPEGLAA